MSEGRTLELQKGAHTQQLGSMFNQGRRISVLNDGAPKPHVHNVVLATMLLKYFVKSIHDAQRHVAR